MRTTVSSHVRSRSGGERTAVSASLCRKMAISRNKGKCEPATDLTLCNSKLWTWNYGGKIGWAISNRSSNKVSFETFSDSCNHTLTFASGMMRLAMPNDRSNLRAMFRKDSTAYSARTAVSEPTVASDKHISSSAINFFIPGFRIVQTNLTSPATDQACGIIRGNLTSKTTNVDSAEETQLWSRSTGLSSVMNSMLVLLTPRLIVMESLNALSLSRWKHVAVPVQKIAARSIFIQRSLDSASYLLSLRIIMIWTSHDL